MSLATMLALRLESLLTQALDLGSAPSYPLLYTYRKDLADGVAADQADKLFTDTRTLAPSATESLDLAGALVDAFGATLTFVKVKALLIRAADANANDVLVGGAAANGFITWVGDATDVVKVKPGGLLLLVAPGAGYAVTAATGDLLKVLNSAGGTSVTYDIIIIGTDA